MAKVYIYQIYFPTSNKSYIGQTKDLENRMNSHLRSGSLVCKALYKYDDWQVSILHTCKTRDEANRIEIEEIRNFNSVAPNGYNQTSGGEGNNYWKGKKNSAVSEANKKRIWSEESRRKVSDGSRGHKLSEESKEKCRQAQLGDKNSAKIPGVGAKISKAKQGKKMSLESKNNMRIARNKPKTNIKRLKTYIKKLEKEVNNENTKK